ncbi:MAG: MFS transporter [Phaeodactylibacter sp.]|nr:MFS transporter [Phaeodactylibacter sp.]
MKKLLTRTIWLLGLVSLFTDMASEMLYPIMPLYLESIGFTVLGIGVLEGIAEAMAGLSKGYFGKLSDYRARKVPFVQLGYLLSALSKPLMAVWTAPLWVLGARTTDRLGKGIRTGARDALLAAEATAATRARVFGFHRGMDTLGAAIGPLLALLFLWVYPGYYRTLFLLAVFPGLAAVAFTLLLKEPANEAVPTTPVTKTGRPGFFSFLKYIPKSSLAYRRLLWGLLAFALVNSSDLFLLLMLKYKGIGDSLLIGFYIFYNLVYALAAFPAGSLADRWGVKPTFISGLLVFVAVYGGMALAADWWQFGLLFLLYGLYAALTEGVAKAWISNLAPAEERATAIGTYEGLRSVATLLASSLAGLIWWQFSPAVLFGLTAAIVMGVAVYFKFVSNLPGFR